MTLCILVKIFYQKNHKNLTIISGDIRDKEKLLESCKNHDIFLNLACISNDTSFVLDEKLSTTISLDAFEPMVMAAKKAKIKDFCMLQQVRFTVFHQKKM